MIKQSFYYPDGGRPFIRAEAILNEYKIAPNMRSDLVGGVIAAIKFEQRERLDYVIQLLGVSHLPKGKSPEFLMLALGDVQTGGRLSEDVAKTFGINIQLLSNLLLNKQILDIIKIFSGVYQQIEMFYTDFYGYTFVRPILPILQRVVPQELSNLDSQISSFSAQVGAYGKEVFDNSLGLPAALLESLEKVGMKISLDRQESLGDKLKFLLGVKTIIQVLIANNAKGAKQTNEQLIAECGRVLYLYDPTPLTTYVESAS